MVRARVSRWVGNSWETAPRLATSKGPYFADRVGSPLKRETVGESMTITEAGLGLGLLRGEKNGLGLGHRDSLRTGGGQASMKEGGRWSDTSPEYGTTAIFAPQVNQKCAFGHISPKTLKISGVAQAHKKVQRATVGHNRECLTTQPTCTPGPQRPQNPLTPHNAWNTEGL